MSAVLRIRGTQEGTDFRFTADPETLKQIAHRIPDCFEKDRVGPWGGGPKHVVIEEIIWEKRGIFGRSSQDAFLSFEKKVAA